MAAGSASAPYQAWICGVRDCDVRHVMKIEAVQCRNKAVLDGRAVDIVPPGTGIEQISSGHPTRGAAQATQNSTTDTGRNPRATVPNPTGAVPTITKREGTIMASTMDILQKSFSGGRAPPRVSDRFDKAAGEAAALDVVRKSFETFGHSVSWRAGASALAKAQQDRDAEARRLAPIRQQGQSLQYRLPPMYKNRILTGRTVDRLTQVPKGW